MIEPTLISNTMPDLLPMKGRSSGMHVSTAIHSLSLQLGHYKERDKDDIPWTRFGLGNALERAIIHRFELDEPGRYIQPGEQRLDDISGTPDLLDILDWVMIEIKLTWMSSKHDASGPKFWRYWVQLMSYCKMMGVDIGRLHVCHVNGNYRYGTKEGEPTYNIWECKFSKFDLEENWSMIRLQAEKIEEEGR